MKLNEFKIGEEFYTAVKKWRCTDIGTRVVAAVEVYDMNDISWLNRPPYFIEELVFREDDLPYCYLEPPKNKTNENS